MAEILKTDKTNLKLDAFNDIVIENGQLQFISGADGVAQAARTRLQLFKGEWMFDLEAGMPYFQEIFVKNPSFPNIESIIRRILADTPGINSQNNIVSVDLVFDGSTRQLVINWRANSEFGPVTGVVTSAS